MITLLSLQQLIISQKQQIDVLSDSISNVIDQQIDQLQILLDKNQVTDLFTPVYGFDLPLKQLLGYNRYKWNMLMDVVQYSHESIKEYLNKWKPCNVRRSIYPMAMDLFNSRIVDLNNMDTLHDDDSCADNSFLDVMNEAVFNVLFPIQDDVYRISNRYSSMFVADLESENYYRYPASGTSTEDITCINDQFSERQQIIIGFGSESNDLIKIKQKVNTQDINLTKKYKNSFHFENRCFDRSVRVFVKDEAVVHNLVPQIITAEEIQDFLKNSQLIDPSIEQIISALTQLSEELQNNSEQPLILSNISGQSTFKPTEVVLLSNCVNSFEVRHLQRMIKKHGNLFASLKNMNVQITFQQSNDSQDNALCQNLKYIIYNGTVLEDVKVIVANNDTPQFKMLPAKMDEFGQMSLFICSKSDKILICSKVPQLNILQQPVAPVIFEKFAEILIIDKISLTIIVDSFHQQQNNQFGQQIESDLQQTLINTIQTNETTSIKILGKQMASIQLKHNVIFIMMLHLPENFCSLIENSEKFEQLTFNASHLCFNLSYYCEYDEQCINKLNVYFPQNYLGYNTLSPHESVYTSGATMTVENSHKFGDFLQNEYKYDVLDSPSYMEIFSDVINDYTITVIAISQENSYQSIKNTYDYIKQNFKQSLYVGRTVIAGVMALYPDNRLTPKTIKTIHNISLSSIFDNTIPNTVLVIKEFLCEYYSDQGVIQDTCVFIGMPYTNFYLAQDFFVVPKSSAFLLFLQNDKQLLDDLKANDLKFFMTSQSYNSLSYNCTTQDSQAINFILYQHAYGQCQYTEQSSTSIAYNFYINNDLFNLKSNIIESSHVISPLTSRQSIILVFSTKYEKQIYYKCEQNSNLNITNHGHSWFSQNWKIQLLPTITPKLVTINTKLVVIYSITILLIAMLS
ncbi:Conserved_hypothetical protein [Hexamita inflata]|uniref:Uncharacterized protein n=1 Tax=Hexamita inflata TaxID=28002 RepID=A0AA86U610_9EUKA|nr:Conserved hypothetical protein [Hexamita inflata]